MNFISKHIFTIIFWKLNQFFTLRDPVLNITKISFRQIVLQSFMKIQKV